MPGNVFVAAMIADTQLMNNTAVASNKHELSTG